MDFATIFSVIIQVIKTPAVIIVFAVVIFYLSFINFVVHYRKKPKVIREKKKSAPKVAVSEASSEPEAEDSDEE